MATAYAAVVSLIHLIDEQIPIHLARRPIYLEPIFLEKQLGEIKSLKEKACFIQDYLEVHSLRDSNEAQDLKRRIVDASYAAADIIESHIVDDIKASFSKERSKKKKKKKTKKKKKNPNEVLVDPEKETVFQSCAKAILNVSEAVQKVIQDMNVIMKEMMQIETQPPYNSTHFHSLRPHPTKIGHDTMVGFDDCLYQIMDKLTGEQSTLQTIPITGMGGIGKTTLAQNIYGNSLIKQHFDICGWVTVSQVYNIEQMLLSLLHGIGVTIDPNEEENNEYHHLGKILYQHLSGRMYLIIVDDLWNTEAWDRLKLFLPDTKGSRIMVTTRLKDVANYVGSFNLHEINLLDENKSWSLLCQKAFAQEGCPRPELEEIGKKIAKECQGLPLSIVVIGGLLAKSKMMLDSWEYVADNINKIISSKDSNCLDILLLSYKQLPIHLQPCFLYMGVFPEDHIIPVTELINLWVAEGFLKTNTLKTLEEVAEEYLKDLIDRHLIMVNEWGSLGTMKGCSIHDLLRELCLQEAHKEKFLLVNEDSSELIIEHHIAIQDKIFWPSQDAFHSTLSVRSLTCKHVFKLSHIPHFKLLRVFNVLGQFRTKINHVKTEMFCTQEFNIDLLNLRLLRLSTRWLRSIHLMHRLWNLQILVMHGTIYLTDVDNFLTLQIWKMPHLRHLICGGDIIYLPDPPDPQRGLIDDSVLENLQTLSGIQSFKCTEEVVRRIPNVKKLEIHYNRYWRQAGSLHYLNNIGRLHKLQSLTLTWNAHYSNNGRDFSKNCEFPHSLKKLSLITTGKCTLENIITRIGLLPHLEKLKLDYQQTEDEWNPVEGQFLRLKVLKLFTFRDLIYWNAENVHFPVLEHLHLKYMFNLKEIPTSIGEIETLQSITLKYCNGSVVASAKNILEEQQSFGNEGLRLTY